jgi:hypothetical protein
MSLKLAFSTLAVAATIVLITALYTHLSLWFLWHLLPEGNIKIAVNSSQPGSQMVTESLSLSPLDGNTTKLLNNTKRYSYAQTNEHSSIALVPKNPFLFKDRNLLIDELRKQNWHTINFGLVIVGTNQDSTLSLPPLRSIIVSTYGKLISPQHPYKPIVIAQSIDGSIPPLSGDTALVGVVANQSREVKAIIAPNLNNFPNFSISGPSLPSQSDYIAVNIPGSVIQSVSAQFSNEWNKVIYSKFGFSATKPSVISYLAVQQTASITITDEKAALAVIGDPASLKNTFHQWMQHEEAYSRPQKHAFRLPDNTIGFELIKGDLQPVLSEPDPSGCLAPTSDAIQLWLCQNDKGVSLATTQKDALGELSSISPSIQRITLGNNYLQHLDFLPVKYLQALTLHSSGDYTLLTAKLKN